MPESLSPAARPALRRSPALQTQDVERVGVVAAPHPGYVLTALSALEAGQCVVPLRAADDQDRIQAGRVSRILTPQAHGPWLTRAYQGRLVDDLALIAFTSGTTGTPKGVMLSHANLADAVSRVNRVMQADDSIREYIGAPPQFSFGFGRCRAVAAAGGSFFIPPRGFNPAEIAVLLKRGEINAISAVPSLWRALLNNRDLIGTHGRRVRWIEVGSQYMSRQEKEALKALFPQARIITMYGLTEASRSTFLEVHAEDGPELDSVGRVADDVAVRIDADGRIALRGRQVASRIIVDGVARPLVDAEGWLTTNDLGSIRGGYLYYHGRADDVVNCGGIKVDPEALEARVIDELKCDSSSLAVCGQPDAARGENFLVTITPACGIDPARVRQAAARALEQHGIRAADAVTVAEVGALPRTGTGKVQRKQLAALVAKRADVTTDAHQVGGNVHAPGLRGAAVDARAAGDDHFLPIFRSVLKQPQASANDSFVSLGGDSLAHVQLSVDIERRLGHLPEGWEDRSIAELSRYRPQRAAVSQVETGLALRVAAIVAIVLGHAGLSSAFAGGVYLLLFISGVSFARFQAQPTIQGVWWLPLASFARSLLVPYLVLAGSYQLWKQELDLPVLLLMSNLISPSVVAVFPVWFINVLAQILLVTCALFAVPGVRARAQASPWAFSAVTAVSGLLLGLALDQAWNTDALHGRVPHLLFWVFALGWVVQFAETRFQKLATSAMMALAVPALSHAGLIGFRVDWFVLGGLLMLWLPAIPAPRRMKLGIQALGAASFHIYLTHMIFIDLVQRRAGLSGWLALPIALLGGVGIWMVLQAWKHKLGAQPGPSQPHEPPL